MNTPMDQPSQSPEHRNSSPEWADAVRQRAQELFEMHGRAPGHDLENWLQAEADVARQFATAEEAIAPSPVSPDRSTRHIVVEVNHVTYTGEYCADSSGGYTPGEFARGAPVGIRFEEEYLYLKRRNGAELKTRIVRKEPENAHGS
jgi:hypothetical protein